jgi:hypothetical protein
MIGFGLLQRSNDQERMSLCMMHEIRIMLSIAVKDVSVQRGTHIWHSQ